MNKGFTLIEVALAIAILGIGLATITTLSTRLVDDTYYEIGRSNGTILAFYLLETQNAAPTDPSQDDASTQNQSGGLISKLDSLGFFSGLNKEEDFPYLSEAWNYQITHEPLTIPLTDTPLDIITVSVRWGNNDFESVRIQTVVKGKDKPNQGTPNPQGGAGGFGGPNT